MTLAQALAATTPAEMREARSWVSDCEWADIADDSELSDRL